MDEHAEAFSLHATWVNVAAARLLQEVTWIWAGRMLLGLDAQWFLSYLHYVLHYDVRVALLFCSDEAFLLVSKAVLGAIFVPDGIWLCCLSSLNLWC